MVESNLNEPDMQDNMFNDFGNSQIKSELNARQSMTSEE
jgi:hypothetical protein